MKSQNFLWRIRRPGSVILLNMSDTDRTAVLLRYFENKSLREVGVTLGGRTACPTESRPDL